MERWPGHEIQEKKQSAESSAKYKGKRNEHRLESGFWQWPHLDYGLIGRVTLVSGDGRVQCSSVVNTSHGTRWMPLGKPTKVFPETRSPQAEAHGHSSRQRAEGGLQYLRTYFPDADFPTELFERTFEAEVRGTRHLEAADPFLGNLLEIMPSHTQNESTVVFPMGELRRQLNISRFSLDSLGNMVFIPAGSPSFTFETPILQISTVVGPSDWAASPYPILLVRTYTSSSLFRLEGSNVMREFDITRSEAGDAPIVDSRILASGPDTVVVNRNGKVYKCSSYRGGEAMQLIGTHEVGTEDDFWQLGITERNDECFLASGKVIKHIDLRSINSLVDVFTVSHPSTIVTSFESPMRDHISRVTTTSDVLWLDDRSRRQPLLSYKHHRSFDRTLKVLTASLGGTSLSLLISRRNSLITLYDVNRGSDGLLHCNSTPSCLSHDGPMFTAFDGHALVRSPSNEELTFLRLCQRGSVRRQDIRITQADEGQPGSVQKRHVTHQWSEDVQTLAKTASELQIDFGPAGGRHYTEVNFRGAYEIIFTSVDHAQVYKDRNTSKNTVVRSLKAWKDREETTESMLTTFDVVSRVEDGKKRTAHFLACSRFDSKHIFNALMHDQLSTQELTDVAQWHYSVQDTSVSPFNCQSANWGDLYEHLEELNLIPGTERHGPPAQREMEAREELVVDLALSNDVYSTRSIATLRSSAAGEAIPNAMACTTQMYCDEEPPEIEFGYFRPVRKAGADRYADQELGSELKLGISSPLGVRLLLAEWEPGTNPKDYTYCDPYGVSETDAQPVPQYRKPPVAPPTVRKKQTQSQQPPLVVAAATQPPIAQTIERVPPIVQVQTLQRTNSQQQFEPGSDAFSQEPTMSTQVLPGPFGGRPGAGKKLAKKRIGGF